MKKKEKERHRADWKTHTKTGEMRQKDGWINRNR
jgi:hypothetical protein